MATRVMVRIGTESRPLSDARPDWINQQLGRRQAEGRTVCVRVTIEGPEGRLTLSTPGCASSGGGSRPPTALERDILELWSDRGLSEPDFTGGNLVAFLNQLRGIMR